MEKKVLLEDLVGTGTNIRKQITSRVVVSDNGTQPAGELWDANKILSYIQSIVSGLSDRISALEAEPETEPESEPETETIPENTQQ